MEAAPSQLKIAESVLTIGHSECPPAYKMLPALAQRGAAQFNFNASFYPFKHFLNPNFTHCPPPQASPPIFQVKL